jgi:methionyl aminopeptidase
MKLSTRSLLPSLLLDLKGEDWLHKQRVAGKVTAGALSLLEREAKNLTQQSMIELSALAEEYILDHKCTPTFKNYKGFPAAVCISVNKTLVHGIPNDYRLQDGDIVKFDLGATYERAIADSAITCIYGTPKSERDVKLLSAGQESLMKGIEAVKIGNRIGAIGQAIYKSVKNSGFNVVTNYGGHSISWDKPHAGMFVPNRSSQDEGVRIQPGLTIAIEPMVLPSADTSSVVSKDGWSVLTKEIGCHWEHTLYVHADGSVEIMTLRDNV